MGTAVLITVATQKAHDCGTTLAKKLCTLLAQLSMGEVASVSSTTVMQHWYIPIIGERERANLSRSFVRNFRISSSVRAS